MPVRRSPQAQPAESAFELLALLDKRVDAADPSRPNHHEQVWRRRLVAQGDTLVHEGSRAQVCFVLLNGCMKRTRVLEDGYEQVLSVCQNGDLMGFEALSGGTQVASIVALKDSEVASLPFAELLLAQHRWPAVTNTLDRVLAHQLSTAETMAHLMAPVGAEARLARFLLWLAQKRVARGESGDQLRLCMCRRDLASLLGVAHETISRSLAQLADCHCIAVDNRQVDILDRRMLLERARATRASGARAPQPDRALAPPGCGSCC